MVDPMAIGFWIVDHTWEPLVRLIRVGKREAEVAREARALATERAQHTTLFEAEERFRNHPAHGITITADDVWAHWRSPDLIEIPLRLTFRSAWVHPITLTKLSGTISFSQGQPGQEFTPEVRDYPIPPLSEAGVQRPYRWQPKIDAPASTLDPAHTSVIEAHLTIFAQFRGHYGDYSLTDQPVSVRVLIPAQGGASVGL